MAASEPGLRPLTAAPGKAWGPDPGTLGGLVCSLPPPPPVVYPLAPFLARLPRRIPGLPSRLWLDQSDFHRLTAQDPIGSPHSAFISAAFWSPLDYTFFQFRSEPLLSEHQSPAAKLYPPPPPPPRFLTARRHFCHFRRLGLGMFPPPPTLEFAKGMCMCRG